MQAIFQFITAVAISAALLFHATGDQPQLQEQPQQDQKQKIQVAILLDVSNSMDGLIDQAKAQLWTMVNTLGRVQCENKVTPEIEFALYEYGTPRNQREGGYIKQINNFIKDLDSLSENLFGLTTNGGDEYCGHVIYRSINELKWDNNPRSYKVIFIAGNESFRQGTVSFTKACDVAKTKGVIVNTIYCGDRMQGIREYWNLQAECGGGTFSNINQDYKIEDIPTPYDSLIYHLNDELNNTYIVYGTQGQQYYYKQQKMDQANTTMSKKAGIKRAETKSNSSVYNNSSWDLVDKAKEGEAVFEKIDYKTLPDSLKNKSKEELKIIVKEKQKQRASIQSQIITLGLKREQYIKDQKNNSTSTTTATLESEIERIIKDQVQKFGMKIQ
ncbi:MAG: hypothetical protein QM725_14545 [Lacibacter sp.]